MVTLPKVTTQR